MSEGTLVPELDSYRKQKRKDVGVYPGVYKTLEENILKEILSSNIFGYKYVHSLLRQDKFVCHMPFLWPPLKDYAKPKLKTYYNNPDSALLNLAEAASFGGGVGCDAH